jgi:hypothetical protein
VVSILPRVEGPAIRDRNVRRNWLFNCHLDHDLPWWASRTTAEEVLVWPACT